MFLVSVIQNTIIPIYSLCFWYQSSKTQLYSHLFIMFLVSVIQNTIIFPFIHYVSGISHPKHNYSYLFIMFLVSVIQNTIIPIYSLHILRAAELRDPWVSGIINYKKNYLSIVIVNFLSSLLFKSHKTCLKYSSVCAPSVSKDIIYKYM